MNQVHFATTNAGKVATIREDLSPFGIEVIHKHMDISEPRSDDIREIARIKALTAFEKIRKPVIVNDSSFHLAAWNGFPRANVNFALQTIGNKGILKLVHGEERHCHFRSCLAFYDGKEVQFFESETPGTICEGERGQARKYNWSSLYLIFIPEGEKKTLAEMTEEEFLAWRKKRFPFSNVSKFAEWFLKG
ncbi:MAG: non-canonical purine NTP pyrophosphatase [Nanoarchaeota archaeon]